MNAFTRKLLGTTRTTDYEVTLRTAAGAELPVEVHSTVLGKGVHVVGVFGVLNVVGAPLARGATSPKLTPRQAQILQALAEGSSTRQISVALGITPETVRNHVRAILRALGVHSRLHAVAEARRIGLLAG
jgi:DNA-binding NarL/FixJ family response regulator